MNQTCTSFYKNLQNHNATKHDSQSIMYKSAVTKSIADMFANHVPKPTVSAPIQPETSDTSNLNPFQHSDGFDVPNYTYIGSIFLQED